MVENDVFLENPNLLVGDRNLLVGNRNLLVGSRNLLVVNRHLLVGNHIGLRSYLLVHDSIEVMNFTLNAISHKGI
jgi:hypothetical protein